jgi:hypothetical protein
MTWTSDTLTACAVGILWIWLAGGVQIRRSLRELELLRARLSAAIDALAEQQGHTVPTLNPEGDPCGSLPAESEYVSPVQIPVGIGHVDMAGAQFGLQQGAITPPNQLQHGVSTILNSPAAPRVAERSADDVFPVKAGTIGWAVAQMTAGLGVRRRASLIDRTYMAFLGDSDTRRVVLHNDTVGYTHAIGVLSFDDILADDWMIAWRP